MILVVGATGQLGSLVVRTLREQGRPVRAVTREPAAADDLAATGAELVAADLRHPQSLDRALEDVQSVVTTANVVAPTHHGDTSEALDAGYRELVTRAQAHGVERFVVPSIPVSSVDEAVPVARTKRRLERALDASSMSYASLRMPPFTEIWLALVGSSLPLRGEQSATLARPYGFLTAFRRLTGATVERHGVMLVPGPASARHAFLSVHDAARLVAAAVDVREVEGGVDVGGPEVLSWSDVAAVFADVLGRPVRVVSAPPAVFGTAQRLLSPVAPSVADIMGLDLLVGTMRSDWDTTAVRQRLGVTDPRTVEQVLREKASLQPVG